MDIFDSYITVAAPRMYGVTKHLVSLCHEAETAIKSQMRHGKHWGLEICEVQGKVGKQNAFKEN